MGSGRAPLMCSPPKRPSHDIGGAGRRPQKDAGEEAADFGDGGKKRGHGFQAAIGSAGLVLFALAEAAMRRKSAASLERKAWAAMTSLIWRCQPWPGPRLAVIEPKIVLGTLEAFPDGPVQSGNGGPSGECRLRRIRTQRSKRSSRTHGRLIRAQS
jgi:hypothetical protein